jgi:hypothetical protein
LYFDSNGKLSLFSSAWQCPGVEDRISVVAPENRHAPQNKETLVMILIIAHCRKSTIAINCQLIAIITNVIATLGR